MTKVKRKRLHLQAKGVLPGDVVDVRYGYGVYPSPVFRAWFWATTQEKQALVIGLDEHLEKAYAYFFVERKFGWISTRALMTSGQT